MEGSNLTRFGRVVAHLVTHPQRVSSYLASGPLSKKSPLQQRLPWFSLAAIRFLDSFLKPSMHVFDYGFGGSTLYFSQRAGSVTATENHQEWLEPVQAELTASGSKNVTLQHRPYDFHRAKNFAQSDYLHSIPDHAFDIIIVDGTEEHIPVRPDCFYHAETNVRPGGIIIVDDSWRYPELRTTHHAKSCRVFRSTGPCRTGVTSTDIFFY